MATDEQVAWLTEKRNQVVAELIQTQEELRLTKGELQKTQETLQITQEELRTTQEALGAAQVQIAEQEKLKTPPPAFVKAEKKKPQDEEKKPRKKREAQYDHVRKRSVPTQIVEHRLVKCLDCHLRLGGRDIHDLKKLYPHDEVLLTWAKDVKTVYEQAVAWGEQPLDLPVCLHANLIVFACYSNTPSSNVSGSSASPMSTRLSLNIPYASGLNSFSLNSLSSLLSAFAQAIGLLSVA